MNSTETELPILFGKDSNGGIKQWSVRTTGNKIVVSYGKLGGKIVDKVTTVKGKNLGKSNETSDDEQATLEANSKWSKQVKKGYSYSIESIPTSMLPNLAHKYQDKGHTVDWDNTYLLPKLDGLRGSAFYKKGSQILQSRGGEEYPVIKEIAEELDNRFFSKYPDSFVDGELYGHGMYLEDIVSCVRKHNSNTPNINFHIFDWVLSPEDKKPWIMRQAVLKVVMMLETGVGSRLKLVPYEKVESEKEMLALHDKYTSMEPPYEGIVLRDTNAVYSFGNRTTGIIKYKVAESEEFEVVGMELDKNGAGVPVCNYTKLDGSVGTFKAPYAASATKRKELWANRDGYIGKYLTVDFEKLSKYNVPTKPIGKSFRDLDEDGNPLN